MFYHFYESYLATIHSENKVNEQISIGKNKENTVLQGASERGSDSLLLFSQN